jgi:hypothetical protein
MARIYWRGVAACLLWIGGLVAAMGLLAGSEGRVLLLIGGALLFFTLQGFYLLHAGHVEVRLRLALHAYRWMSWIWVALFCVATALLTVPVINSLRAAPPAALMIAALLLLLIPAGCAAIMAGIGLQLRRQPVD